EICFPVASVTAMLETGKKLVFSEDSIRVFDEELAKKYKEMGVPEEVLEHSRKYGKEVAVHILTWAGEDNYKQTRTFPRYPVTEDIGRWKPTPPGYFDAIEPHWNVLRPFVLDSAMQFKPAPPPAYDLKPGSEFHEDLMEVYEVGENLDEEKKEIASFWDCNPFVIHHKGHLMFSEKKITPGGHWVGIAGIACQQAEADFTQSVETYAWTTLALADAFISCWDEKYRSSLIRPETVINSHIDEDWKPLLQTPPFPEYTSGHSVISTAAAHVLTHLYGDNFAFLDTTEVVFGLPPRAFPSFLVASQEAAISRLYGGIHYMPAIEQGVAQGEGVGKLIIQRLITRNPNSDQLSVDSSQ
ncbi:MAG: vanadium-dependent haloperoxidase, partial [Bacteroidota bacterium]